MSGRYVAAIDIGTTAAKAMLLDADGAVSHPVTVALDTRHAPDGAITQSPDAWFDALRHAARAWWAAGIDAAQIALIAPCGQMQNMVALDDRGEPVGDALLYADRRAVDEAAAINARFGAAALHRRLGNPLDAGSLPPKLLRWRDRDPTAFARTCSVLLGAKDFVTFRLTGALVVDPSTASTTGMYRLFDGDWDVDLLADLALEPALLPRIVAACDVAGHVTAAAAAATGFAAGTPVLCGLGDAVATGEGAAIATSLAADRYLYLGTSAWIAGTTALPPAGAAPPSAGVIRLAGVDAGRMVLIAPALNGGCVLDWSLGLLGHRAGEPRVPYFERFEAELLASPASPRRPLFLPFLHAERCPVPTQGAGGTFLHVGSDTTRADLLRAVLDGTALALRWCADLLPAGEAPAVLPVVGGGTHFRPWLQSIADALGVTLQAQPDADRLAALGIAGLAARTLGWAPPRAGAAPAVEPVAPTAAGVARLAASSPAFRRATALLGQLDPAPIHPPEDIP